jgi:L-alanine-DL-glutamate epimerase-like enolase superfamily enzyme
MSALAGIDIALWDLKGEGTNTNLIRINVDKIQPED